MFFVNDRKDHWQSIYRDRSPSEVSWYQGEPTLSMELIRSCGLRKDAPLIDVGGGASVLVDRLVLAGFTELSVLDISGLALSRARERLGDAADRVTWIEADITQFTPPRHYALWHDRAVFHFLTDSADRESYIAALNAGLSAGGHLIIAAFAIGGPEQCSGLPIVQYDAAKLQAELGAGFRLLETRQEAHITPAGKTQQFGYFRLVRAD